MSCEPTNRPSNPWTELYDPKDARKHRSKFYPFSLCDECQRYGGHRIDCSSCTPEDVAWLAKFAQEQEERAKERADRYWKMLQHATGKLAILKHENNKLRKANDKLRAKEQENAPNP